MAILWYKSVKSLFEYGDLSVVMMSRLDDPQWQCRQAINEGSYRNVYKDMCSYYLQVQLLSRSICYVFKILSIKSFCGSPNMSTSDCILAVLTKCKELFAFEKCTNHMIQTLYPVTGSAVDVVKTSRLRDMMYAVPKGFLLDSESFAKVRTIHRQHLINIVQQLENKFTKHLNVNII